MNKINKFLLLIFIFCFIQNIIATTTTLESETNQNNISWITWLFIKLSNMISFMISLSQLPMLPFIWMTQWLFQQIVITPYHMAVEASNILYPIIIYCATACFCGAIIGFFSGFATEAIIIMFMNATWGKDVAKKYREKKYQKKKQDDETTKKLSSRENDSTFIKNEKEEENQYYHHEWDQPTIQSPTSSLYRFSISSDTSSIHPIPTSFYDDKQDQWDGNDDDPEEIASFLRQRRNLQYQ